MQLFSTLIVAALAATTSAAPQQDDALLALRAVFTQSKTGDRATSVKVFDMPKTELYGESNSNRLDTGSFAEYPIVFDVDCSGKGTVSVGDNKSKTVGVNNDDGAVCQITSDDKTLVVDCDVAMDSSWEPESVTELRI